MKLIFWITFWLVAGAFAPWTAAGVLVLLWLWNRTRWWVLRPDKGAPQ